VNLETEFKVGFKPDVFRGTVVDISEGGCRVVADSIVFAGINDRIVLTFALPDDRVIKEIEGVVRNVLHDRMRKRTELGIQFKGPESEISKINSFCQFCQYFKV
jgi:c-di-GMP-binding flagellar brake protein YcgR